MAARACGAMRRRMASAVLLACIASSVNGQVTAHPMPNTVIAVSFRDDGTAFDIAVPLPELRLALPMEIPRSANLLAEPHRSDVAAYFNHHFAVASRLGVPQPHTLRSMAIWETTDPDVGGYEELRLQLFVPASSSFDARDFMLSYDAVIHQVANHFALVHVAQDFRAGVIAQDGDSMVGVLRFDFARNEVSPLPVTAAPGSVWRGLRSAVALGFHHVLAGLDHILFIVTLLVVAPLRAIDRRWSLFQGWRHAVRRFLGISIAFTIGHSLALLIGTYNVVAIPRAPNEVIIAASILIAAIHAIRPFFSGREWVVAAGFGTVHGLAFSESLVGLDLTPWVRALVVLGFNVGVEGAQLVAMACALPLLIASRWRIFHTIRIAGMVCTAALAIVWILERAHVVDVSAALSSPLVAGGLLP